MKKIVVAGHICLDITPEFPGSNGKRMADILIPGKLINMKGVNVNTGGVVGNTGIGLKVLGADVALMGKIGKDSFGELVLNLLDKYELADGMIISDEVETSYTVVLAVPGFDRIFLHNPGANHTFCYDDLNLNIIKKAALFHFGYPPLMKSMYENTGAALIQMMESVKKLGVATSMDMAAIDSDSEAGCVNWEQLLRAVMPFVDFFVPSLEELVVMVDPSMNREWRERAGDRDLTEVITVVEIIPLADRLIDWGAKIVLIKCGAMGMYLRTSTIDILEQIGGSVLENPELWSNISHFEASYLPNKILSATGAGDISVAAFLFAMTQGYPWQDCLKLATAAGSSCVETYDAISGLCTLEQLNEKINKGWEKQQLLHE